MAKVNINFDSLVLGCKTADKDKLVALFDEVRGTMRSLKVSGDLSKAPDKTPKGASDNLNIQSALRWVRSIAKPAATKLPPDATDEQKAAAEAADKQAADDFTTDCQRLVILHAVLAGRCR